jgi:hypothetical protein
MALLLAVTFTGLDKHTNLLCYNIKGGSKNVYATTPRLERLAKKTNTLAYLATSPVTKKKSYIILPPGLAQNLTPVEDQEPAPQSVQGPMTLNFFGSYLTPARYKLECFDMLS